MRRTLGGLLCSLAIILVMGADAGPQAAPDDASSPDHAGAADHPAGQVPGGEDAGQDARPNADPRPLRRRAALIRVPVPITDSVDERVKRAISRVLDDWPDQADRPIVVLEFWPANDDSDAVGSEFERALSLARFLVSDRMSRARMVAYLPRSIVGHAVLPVLACEEIVMHPDAEFGAAGLGESSIDPIMLRGYSEIAERRRTIPEAVALGMLDPQLVVYRADTAAGPRYVLDSQLAELEAETTVRQLDTVIAQGDLGRFSGSELRLTHGFVSHLASDRRALATALGLRPDELDFDPSLGESWRAIRVDVTGPITETLVAQWQRGIDEQRRANRANLICLVVNSPGGDPLASAQFATYLAQLDGSQVRTTAFVDGGARGDAALIPFACDHIVMTPAATLGGDGAHQPTAEETQDLVTAARVLARDKERRWSVAAAMMDPEMEVRRYTLRGADAVEYFTEEELAEQPDPGRYEAGAVITEPGRRLALDADRAEAYGVARYVVSGFGEFKQLYQLDREPVAIDPSWAHRVVDTLAAPHVAGTLLFFGGLALIFELSSPGIGIGGFVSCVCFALYFWSQFLNNTATVLEIVLFVTGMLCIAVEVLVLPGFGIFGLGGAALVVVSLVLASQTFVLPQNDYQFREFPKSLLMVGAACGGISVGLIVLHRYLEHAPFLRRILLQPPAGDELEELQHRESLVAFDHLLQQTGVTATPLRPAGKAYFGTQLVDVITEGDLVDKGAQVMVTEVRGNRVVVIEVPAAHGAAGGDTEDTQR